jgi:Ctr copper transporter family protein
MVSSGVTAQAANTMSSMDGMDMTSGHSHGDKGMLAVFFNSMDTSLYSSTWTPTSTAGYAGTCIFLVLFAALFRGLLAGKAVLEQRWMDQELARRYVAVRGKQPFSETVSQDSMAKEMVLSANGVEENVRVVERKRNVVRPFRLTVDPARACLDVVIAGVGYLL